MKVSLNTIKQYIDFELPPIDELVARINAQLGGVEEVTDLTAKYNDVVIVKVVTAEKHPNADKLTVCTVDDSGVVADVPRDEQGYVQVVCGAPNVRAGMYAAWLPPQSTVPASYDDAEPFVLSARELRGAISQGMLAAPDELAIGTGHDGILEIDPNEWKPTATEIKPGASFAAVYGLDDTIIDIENKMFTHRPDCFGQLGVAREIAGIFGKQFTSPEWYTESQEVGVKSQENTLALEVYDECPELVSRFVTVAIDDVTVKPSPLWLQCELVRLGSKPINNIVDVTNYVMLLTAQPTHAYDYDKLHGHTLGARMAKPGEKAQLLNGKTYELTEDDIVIADGEGVVGLGGIMGGGTSEVSAETTRIVLEVASFDMYTVRKTSMRYGLFTDALTRFSKGQSPLQNMVVMELLMRSVVDVAGGKQASDVFDICNDMQQTNTELYDFSHTQTPSVDFINKRLGTNLSLIEMQQILKNVEFNVSSEEGSLDEHHRDAENYPALVVTPPFWRTDIELPEDVVEEVGRLYGFDKLPRELPMRSIAPAPKNTVLETKKYIRDQLSQAGCNEVLTYSFVHKNVLERASQDAAQAYALGNALSPDLQYYRLSLIPSLLDKVHMNSKAGYDEFALFEIGKAHRKGDVDKDGLPIEYSRIALVYAAKKQNDGAAYFQAKRLFEQLSDNVTYIPLDTASIGDEITQQMVAPFEPTRSALVMSGDVIVGVVGEYKADVARAFKLSAACAGFELQLSYFENHNSRQYRPLSRFPSVTQDISLKVASDVPYRAVFESVTSVIDTLDETYDTNLAPLNIYQAKENTEYKTITLRLRIANHEKTLTDKDVNVIMDQIAAAVHASYNAERV